MITENFKDGNAYGCAIAASGDIILLQLNDCIDGEQVRVSLQKDEAELLAQNLAYLASCLSNPIGKTHSNQTNKSIAGSNTMKTHTRFKVGNQDGYLNIHREWAEPTRTELLNEIWRLRSLLAAAVVFAVGAVAVIIIMAVMR